MEFYNRWNQEETEKSIRKTVEDCMDIIERSGISAFDALNIPKCLAEEIEYGNRSTLGTTPFKRGQAVERPADL